MNLSHARCKRTAALRVIFQLWKEINGRSHDPQTHNIWFNVFEQKKKLHFFTRKQPENILLPCRSKVVYWYWATFANKSHSVLVMLVFWILVWCQCLPCFHTFSLINLFLSVTDSQMAATHAGHSISIPSPPPSANQRAGMHSPPPRRAPVREFSGTYESLPARSVQVRRPVYKSCLFIIREVMFIWNKAKMDVDEVTLVVFLQ